MGALRARSAILSKAGRILPRAIKLVQVIYMLTAHQPGRVRLPRYNIGTHRLWQNYAMDPRVACPEPTGSCCYLGIYNAPEETFF